MILALAKGKVYHKAGRELEGFGRRKKTNGGLPMM
jgi:hypothetical protein